MAAMYDGKTKARFWSKVDRRGSDDCWEWQGSRDKDGYGRFHLRGSETKAHRFSFELHYGPIPVGKMVCHSCDNPPCVNPSHLWLGTNQDNINDAAEKGRTHSPKGELHPMAILTREDVEEIIALRQKGYRYTEIAERFDVTPGLVGGIIRGNIWPHIERPDDLEPSAKGLKGEEHPQAKLTEENVREIRKLYATGQYRQVDLADRFGVTQVLISKIVRRVVWAYVDDEGR